MSNFYLPYFTWIVLIIGFAVFAVSQTEQTESEQLRFIQTFKNALQTNLREKLPYLASLGDYALDENYQTEDNYNYDTNDNSPLAEGELLKRMFVPTGIEDGVKLAEQFAFLRKTNLYRHLLDSASTSVKDFLSSEQSLSLLLQNLFQYNADNVLEMTPARDKDKHAGSYNTNTDDSPDDGEFHVATKGRGPERNQTSGYEGCRRDYAQLAEPFTKSILYAIHSALVAVCETECGRPPSPPLCLICRAIPELPPPPIERLNAATIDCKIK